MLALVLPASAETPLPPPGGRVVDAAGVIPPGRRAALEAKLKAHEDKTTDQIVVATVPSLGGEAVEDYANRLYRSWKLGTAARSNGVLFLVAPADRKVRIEVGYGLEGALTDALSGVIIRTAVTPKFKAGDLPGGIEAGADAILGVLSGDADDWQRRATVRADPESDVDWIAILILFIFLAFLINRIFSARAGPTRTHRTAGGSWVALPSSGGFSSGSSGDGGFGGGGGFSGGGGSSGGGGASGSW